LIILKTSVYGLTRINNLLLGQHFKHLFGRLITYAILNKNRIYIKKSFHGQTNALKQHKIRPMNVLHGLL